MVGGCCTLSPFGRALAGSTSGVSGAHDSGVGCLAMDGRRKTSEEVAILLGVSPNTVNYHVKNAIRKLHVTNKAAAVARMLRLRLLM